MDLECYDGKCVRITTVWGEIFEGVVSYDDKEYAFHEYGREEEALHLVPILFFENDISNIVSLEDVNGPYGHFSEKYGLLEMKCLLWGTDFIEEVFDSEDDEQILRMLECMKDAGVKEITEMPSKDHKYKVAVLDLGIKRSILRELNARGCDLTIYPYGTKAKTILAAKPDGVFVSNGPGDPEAAKEEIIIVEKLITNSNYGPDQMPVFGICMGHQIIALSQGGKTYKLQYGHRGCNHGVFDKKTGRSYITSQNHGYAVSADSVVLKGLDVTHLNLNDGTVEGMEHISKPVFSVQFHPESNPGPHDTGYLFDKFIDLMKGGRL